MLKINCPVCLKQQNLVKERDLGYCCSQCQSLIGSIPDGVKSKANFYPIDTVKGYKIAKGHSTLYCLSENQVIKVNDDA